MTQEELKRLDLNLTKSDSKAKPGFLRGKVGLLPGDQGFIPLDSVPLFTYKNGREVPMQEFLEDYKALELKVNKLQEENATLNRNLLELAKQEQLKYSRLELRVKQLEDIQLEHDQVVVE